MREKQKLYYRCRFTQLSPLRLSGGKNDRTDNDLMLDSRGLPMIPCSALAGVLLAPHLVNHIDGARMKLFATLFLILALVVIGEIAVLPLDASTTVVPSWI